MRAVVAAGAVGANVEDADPANPGSLFPIDVAAERIASARAAAAAPFTLNARIDSYLTGVADAYDDAVERAARYVAAGAEWEVLSSSEALDGFRLSGRQRRSRTSPSISAAPAVASSSR